jgi:hypothetical protein
VLPDVVEVEEGGVVVRGRRAGVLASKNDMSFGVCRHQIMLALLWLYPSLSRGRLPRPQGCGARGIAGVLRGLLGLVGANSVVATEKQPRRLGRRAGQQQAIVLVGLVLVGVGGVVVGGVVGRGVPAGPRARPLRDPARVACVVRRARGSKEQLRRRRWRQ